MELTYRADNPQEILSVVFSYVGPITDLKYGARIVYSQVNILYEWVSPIVLRQLDYKQFHHDRIHRRGEGDLIV
jgi:hypothetical protein